MPSITLEEFAERLTAVMPIVIKSMIRYEENALSMGCINPSQYWALNWLGQTDGATMNEFAEATNMRPSTATMLVDRLVEMNQVERHSDPDDRRKVLVRLTDDGRKMLTEINEQKKNALRETFRPLHEDEREQYLSLIETLADRLENQ